MYYNNILLKHKNMFILVFMCLYCAFVELLCMYCVFAVNICVGYVLCNH